MTEGTVVVNVDYLDGYQYKNGGLSFFPTAEGYVDYTANTRGGSAYNYVYQYKDHLGNIRANYGWTPPAPGELAGTVKIKEENHYYPFGLQHGNYNVDYLEYQEIGGEVVLYPPLNANDKLRYNYKYQEQERQDELGLNWDSFKWRNYDYAIGRFFNIDPLSEKYAYQSPYNFSENRVINSRELEGLEAKLAIHGTGNAATAYTNSDIVSFRNRANNLKAAGYMTAQASTGKDIVSAFKTATAKEGSISRATIFAHSGYNGVYLNNDEGFYKSSSATSGAGRASIADVAAGMKDGSIKFEEDAILIFAGCNVNSSSDPYPMAIATTTELGVSSIASTGYVGPEIVNGKETGKLVTDGTFIKNEKVYDVTTQSLFGGPMTSTFTSEHAANFFAKLNGGNNAQITSRIQQTDLGNTINPSTF